jgi:hypothetical protein
MARLACAVVYTSLLVAIGSARAESFVVDCQLPFENIKKHHPIDDNCAAHGSAEANDSPEGLQNLAKNNLCAPTPTPGPALVTFISFKKLQQKLDQKAPEAKHWSAQHLPASRSVLVGVYTTSENATIGEGSVVKFAAWLMKLRPGHHESCNCDNEGSEMNDMHLVLISSSDRENTPECNSVTAEISPHFRPDQWDGDALLKANDHPLRFTGQLMYDAAHRPCSGSPPKGSSGTPSRVASWELHPVYGIDVCTKKSLNSCKADNDSVWVPLDQWQGDE